MKQKELNKTFMMISIWFPWFVQTYLSIVRVVVLIASIAVFYILYIFSFNHLNPHDALKHHFTSLKTDLIFVQQRVLE